MYDDESLRIGEKLRLSGRGSLTFLQQKEEECPAKVERARKLEKEGNKMKIRFELQMKENDLEIEQIKYSKVTTSERSESLRPKYDEANDNADSFLERLEGFAISQD
jgi:hypothetical protein